MTDEWETELLQLLSALEAARKRLRVFRGGRVRGVRPVLDGGRDYPYLWAFPWKSMSQTGLDQVLEYLRRLLASGEAGDPVLTQDDYARIAAELARRSAAAQI